MGFVLINGEMAAPGCYVFESSGISPAKQKNTKTAKKRTRRGGRVVIRKTKKRRCTCECRCGLKSDSLAITHNDNSVGNTMDANKSSPLKYPASDMSFSLLSSSRMHTKPRSLFVDLDELEDPLNVVQPVTSSDESSRDSFAELEDLSEPTDVHSMLNDAVDPFFDLVCLG